MAEEQEQPPAGYRWCEECGGFGEYFWGESDNLRHAECRECNGTGLVETEEDLEKGQTSDHKTNRAN